MTQSFSLWGVQLKSPIPALSRISPHQETVLFFLCYSPFQPHPQHILVEEGPRQSLSVVLSVTVTAIKYSRRSPGAPAQDSGGQVPWMWYLDLNKSVNQPGPQSPSHVFSLLSFFSTPLSLAVSILGFLPLISAHFVISIVLTQADLSLSPRPLSKSEQHWDRCSTCGH